MIGPRPVCGGEGGVAVDDGGGIARKLTRLRGFGRCRHGERRRANGRKHEPLHISPPIGLSISRGTAIPPGFFPDKTGPSIQGLGDLRHGDGAAGRVRGEGFGEDAREGRRGFAGE